MERGGKDCAGDAANSAGAGNPLRQPRFRR